MHVYYESRVVGTIDIALDGPGFTYSDGWLATKNSFPVSILMPRDANRVPPDIFLSWAMNLLPESADLKTISRILGKASGDVIGILADIGRDTAGALSIGRPGNTSSGNWRLVKTADDLERIINELPSKPFLVGDDGVSMSLAGAQTKLGVAVDDQGRIHIPIEGSPSTHILKPDTPSLWGGVHNEAFCLTLAKRVGIPTAKVTTGIAGKRTYLLVTRYDRRGSGNIWRRLHQEDFCQALGKPPYAKYESNTAGISGPTLAEMFDMVRKNAAPSDIIPFLDMVIFNVIVNNTDSHAKNYSILIGNNANRIAPLYDVMCADPWENVTKNMAQKIAGKTRGGYLMGRHWERFASECGLGPRQVLGRVHFLCTKVILEANAAMAEVSAMPAGSHPILSAIVEGIDGRARSLISQLKEIEPKPSANHYEDDSPPGTDGP